MWRVWPGDRSHHHHACHRHRRRHSRVARILQTIYTSNGGLAEAAEAAAPVAYWKKVTGAFAISGLVLFPAFFLLSFGVAQGKPAVKAWFIDAMMMINLEVRTISRDAARRTDPPPLPPRSAHAPHATTTTTC